LRRRIVILYFISYCLDCRDKFTLNLQSSCVLAVCILCNTRQRTPQHTARTAAHCNTLQRTATHCNTLQHTVTHCSTLQHSVLHCSTLHTLQHTAPHCTTLQIAGTGAVALVTCTPNGFGFVSLFGTFVNSLKVFTFKRLSSARESNRSVA